MIIFLHGPDTFRSRHKLKELKEKFIREVDKSGLNLNTLPGEKLELEQLEKDLLLTPFLAKKRMVIIEDLISSHPSKQLQKGVLELLKNKVSQQTIVIYWEGELPKNISADNLLFKNLILEKYVFKFDLLKDQQLKIWYQKKIAILNANISPDALNYLINIVGNNLWQANQEIEKITAYCRNRIITLNDVKKLTQNKLDENIFNLTDSLGQKNKKRALKLINDQLKLGTNKIELLNKIIWQFRNLLMTKCLVLNFDKNITSWQLAEKLNLHPFVAKKTLGQINNFNLEEIKKIYQNLLAADLKIKTSQTESKLLFDLLITKI